MDHDRSLVALAAASVASAEESMEVLAKQLDRRRLQPVLLHMMMSPAEITAAHYVSLKRHLVSHIRPSFDIENGIALFRPNVIFPIR